MSHDATADSLKRYSDTGSDLTRPMKMDYFVSVPTESAGESVATRAGALGFKTKVEPDSIGPKWTCYCTKTMVPEYKAVVAIERQLDALGREFGGSSDGFGSFGNAPTPT